MWTGVKRRRDEQQPATLRRHLETPSGRPKLPRERPAALDTPRFPTRTSKRERPRIEKEEKRPRGSRTPREVAVRPPQLPSDKRRGGRTGNRDRRPENESGVARWEGALGLQVRQAQTAVAPFPEARGAARGPPGGGCFSTSGQTSEMSEKAWSLTCARRGHPRAPGAGAECANSGPCPPSPETSPGSPCLWDPFPIDEGNYNPQRMRPWFTSNYCFKMLADLFLLFIGKRLHFIWGTVWHGFRTHDLGGSVRNVLI